MKPTEERLSMARRRQLAGPGLLLVQPGREWTQTRTCARELFHPTMGNDTGQYRLSRQQGSGFE
jgi:hypothetical protein